MATPSKKGKYHYEANDIVDDQLFEVVTKHVNVANIGTFGQRISEDSWLDPFAGQLERVSKIPFEWLAKIERFMRNICV